MSPHSLFQKAPHFSLVSVQSGRDYEPSHSQQEFIGNQHFINQEPLSQLCENSSTLNLSSVGAGNI